MKVWQVVSDPNSVVLMNYEQDDVKVKFNGNKGRRVGCHNFLYID